MNKEKHTDINYCAFKEKAGYFVSKKRFRSLTELDNDHFEIELAKNRINLHLPIQISYFVPQYAKLRMLQFYYDCIDKFCSRQEFELISMYHVPFVQFKHKCIQLKLSVYLLRAI